ncbi:MAG: HDOD domain-containing protein [Pseudomonadales bacterium]
MTNGIARATPHADALRARLRVELSTGALELPVLPNVAAAVLASSIDDQSDAARLADLIQQDQSLAGHVLRVTNSPAFRGATEIVALQQAIARLGMERIREIALSASLKGALFRGGRYHGLAESAWQVALASGLWAKEFARAARRNVEIAYLCGLLHNIGVPVLAHRLGELDESLSSTEAQTLVEQFAPRAGVALARSWQLPDPVVAAIEHVAEPAAAGPHAAAVAVAACGVAVARWMIERSLLVADVVKLPAVAQLNLYPEDVEGILERKEGIRAAMESMVL